MDDARPALMLRDAVEMVGGQAAMARLLKISQPTVFRWLRDNRPVPPQHALNVESATGISRHDLRPDIYPLTDNQLDVRRSLFDRFGGLPETAEALGQDIATIIRWNHERRIPAEHQRLVLQRGEELGLGITAEDVIFPFPDDRRVR